MNREEKMYYIKQKLYGLIIIGLGIFIPVITEGDATVSVLIIPLGILVLFTKEKVITIDDCDDYDF